MAAIKAKVILEHDGKQIPIEELQAKAKQQWADSGKPIKDIEDFKMYLKPEDGKAYVLINGDCGFSIEL